MKKIIIGVLTFPLMFFFPLSAFASGLSLGTVSTTAGDLGGTVGGYVYAGQVTANASGVIKYVKFVTNSACPIKIGLYSDTGDAPDALLNSIELTSASGSDIQTASFPDTTVTSGNKYWIAQEASSGCYNRYGVSGTGVYMLQASPLEDPFGASDGSFTGLANAQLVDSLVTIPTANTTTTTAAQGLISGFKTSALSGLGTMIPVGAVLLISVAIVYFIIKHFRALSRVDA